MAEKPILFNGNMVRAILDGRKTQTRRIIKIRDGEDFCARNAIDQAVFTTDSVTYHAVNPPCREGDVLWVRETFGGQVRNYGGGVGRFTVFCATNPKAVDYISSCGTPFPVKWKPSIHMPRWACRLFLRVKSVRVERLQEISEADAIAEGFPFPKGQNENYPDRARYWFKNLWSDVYGSSSWESNPLVWVVEFERIENYKPEVRHA